MCKLSKQMPAFEVLPSSLLWLLGRELLFSSPRPLFIISRTGSANRSCGSWLTEI